MNFHAGIASGFLSDRRHGDLPVQHGTIGAVAGGLSQTDSPGGRRAFKERRKLVLVPRETPLNVIQLRNLTTCAEAGAVILPACPRSTRSHGPLKITSTLSFGRICDQMGRRAYLLRRWGGETESTD